MTTTMRDGTTALDPRLDRLVQFDPKSRDYRLATFLANAGADHLPAPTRGRSWRPGRGLDQGREGQCVRYGVAHWQNARPRRLTPPLVQTDSPRLTEDYWEFQRRDPWAGGEYPGASPRYAGTSVLAAMQVGRERGWWDSYWWAGAGSGDVLGDVTKGLARVGGGVAGLAWYRSMFDPRPSGLMEVDRSSGLAGGHCLYFAGVRLKMRLRSEWRGTRTVYVCQQSWGIDHGVADLSQPGGFIYFTEDALGSLLEDQGEMAFPVLAAA